MLDTQRAGMWKRMSAALFDVIILFTVIVGMALLLSAVLDYDQHIERMDQLEAEYAEKYGIDFDITAEELKALSEEELKIYEEEVADMKLGKMVKEEVKRQARRRS